jgi:signal peptidase I
LKPRDALALAACLLSGSCFLACPPAGPSSGEETRAFQIANNSMAPTLVPGDHVFAHSLRQLPRHGEVVIYVTPDGPRVKRVVGVPSDTIAMRGGVLSVNGVAVNEPYAVPQDVAREEFGWQRRFLLPGVDPLAYRPTLNSWGPLVVPAGRYFVLGDNRGDSADSRYIGFLDLAGIVQVPTMIYFSRDPETGSVRWDRIGRHLSQPP